MIEQLSGPAEAVSVDEAAAALRLDLADGDALLSGYLLAARELLEADAGRLFGRRRLRLTLDAWSDVIVLPGPLQSVEAVRFTDGMGVMMTLEPSQWRVKRHHGVDELLPREGCRWPALGRDGVIEIELEAGEEPISETARAAIVMLAGYWFDNPQGAPPAGYLALMKRLRVRWL